MCRGTSARAANLRRLGLATPLLLTTLLLIGAAPVQARAKGSAVRAGLDTVDPAEYEGVDAILDEAERRYFGRLNAGSKTIIQAFLRKAGVRDGKAVPLTRRRMLIFPEGNASAAQLNNGVSDLGGDLRGLDLDAEWDRRLIAYAVEEIQGTRDLNYVNKDGEAAVTWIREVTPYVHLAIGEAIVRDLKEFEAAGGVEAIKAFLQGGEAAPSEEEVRWTQDRLLRRFWWLDKQLPDANYGSLVAPGVEDPAVERVRAAYEHMMDHFEEATLRAARTPAQQTEEPEAGVLGN